MKRDDGVEVDTRFTFTLFNMNSSGKGRDDGPPRFFSPCWSSLYYTFLKYRMRENATVYISSTYIAWDERIRSKVGERYNGRSKEPLLRAMKLCKCLEQGVWIIARTVNTRALLKITSGMPTARTTVFSSFFLLLPFLFILLLLLLLLLRCWITAE